MKKFAVLLSMTLLAAPTLAQAATAAANTINSAAIIKADGTSGQTLTTGNGVKTGHIQDAAITASKLAAGSVSSSKIFGQLSTSKLRVGTVAGTVAAGNHTHVINTADLAAGAVTGAKLAAGSVTAANLAAGAVGAPSIAAGAVTSGAIAAGAVTANGIAAGAVGTGAILDGAVTASKLAAGSVGAAALVAGSVTSTTIAAGAVTDGHILSISADKITGLIGPDKMGAYAGVKVVHTGAADGVNTFSSITAAIQAIGVSNPAGRFAIVIMPGTYKEDFTFLNTWNVAYNIDLIGQSRTGTVIEPQGNPWRSWDLNYKPCIRLADGMFFKNLTIRGSLEVSASVGVGIIGCNIDVVGATGVYGAAVYSHYPSNVIFDDVEMNSDGCAMWLYNWQDVEHLTLNNIRIKLTTPGSGGIWIFPSRTDAPLKFKNLTITGAAGAYGIQFFSYVSGAVEFDNLTIDGQIPSFSYGNSGTISVNVRNGNLNSTAGFLDNNSGASSLDFTVDNSVVNNAITTSASPIKIGNSKIAGPIQGGGLVTVVNSYNGAYQPIANGAH